MNAMSKLLPPQLEGLKVGDTFHYVAGMGFGQSIDLAMVESVIKRTLDTNYPRTLVKIQKYTVKSIATTRLTSVEPAYCTWNREALVQCFRTEKEAKDFVKGKLQDLLLMADVAKDRISSALSKLP